MADNINNPGATPRNLSSKKTIEIDVTEITSELKRSATQPFDGNATDDLAGQAFYGTKEDHSTQAEKSTKGKYADIFNGEPDQPTLFSDSTRGSLYKLGRAVTCLGIGVTAGIFGLASALLGGAFFLPGALIVGVGVGVFAAWKTMQYTKDWRYELPQPTTMPKLEDVRSAKSPSFGGMVSSSRSSIKSSDSERSVSV